jgi:hypothetical protein
MLGNGDQCFIICICWTVIGNEIRYNWTIVLPAELSAATALVHYWDPPKELWGYLYYLSWIILRFFLVIIFGRYYLYVSPSQRGQHGRNNLANGAQLLGAVAVNCLRVGTYGEIEFWFSVIKILTIAIISWVSERRSENHLTSSFVFTVILGIVLDLGAGDDG